MGNEHGTGMKTKKKKRWEEEKALWLAHGGYKLQMRAIDQTSLHASQNNLPTLNGAKHLISLVSAMTTHRAITISFCSSKCPTSTLTALLYNIVSYYRLNDGRVGSQVSVLVYRVHTLYAVPCPIPVFCCPVCSSSSYNITDPFANLFGICLPCLRVSRAGLQLLCFVSRPRKTLRHSRHTA